MFNQFQGIGNLAADPESKYTASGKQVVNFTVCCDYGYGDKKKTEYVRCFAWEKLAEIIAEYCQKGSKVFIQGTMQTRSWESDGKKMYTTEINVQTLKMLSPKQEQRTEPNKEERYPQDAGGNLGTGEDVPFSPIF